MSDADNLLFLINGIRQNSRHCIDSLLKDYGLKRNEWLVLACLKHASQVTTQHYIKNYLGVDNSNLTKILDTLEQQGFIKKTIAKTDRRSRITALNPKQSRAIEKIFELFDKINSELLNVISKAEQKTLLTSLEKIKHKSNLLVEKI